MIILDDETWKTIENYPDYQVSSLGRIKSFKQDKINGKIIRQHKCREYFKVVLWRNGEGKNKYIHILVFEAFNNYKLKDDEDVHHVDEDTENNNFENLIMMPKSEHSSFHTRGNKNPNFGNHSNLSKDYKIKISKSCIGKYIGEKNNNSILITQDVIQIKLLLKEGKLTNKEIADIFGVNRRTISQIKNGKRWNHIKI